MIEGGEQPAQQRKEQPAPFDAAGGSRLTRKNEQKDQRCHGHAVKRGYRAGRIGPADKQRGQAERKDAADQRQIGEDFWLIHAEESKGEDDQPASRAGISLSVLTAAVGWMVSRWSRLSGVLARRVIQMLRIPI